MTTTKEKFKMKTNFYICKKCGNIVEKIHDSGAPLVCCGEKMHNLEAGVVEASREKHIPVVTVSGNTVTVDVGSVTHPMAEEHSILWIALETDKGVFRKHLKPGEAPRAVFALTDERPKAVYAYCNLHGLWMAEA